MHYLRKRPSNHVVQSIDRVHNFRLQVDYLRSSKLETLEGSIGRIQVCVLCIAHRNNTLSKLKIVITGIYAVPFYSNLSLLAFESWQCLNLRIFHFCGKGSNSYMFVGRVTSCACIVSHASLLFCKMECAGRRGKQ